MPLVLKSLNSDDATLDGVSPPPGAVETVGRERGLVPPHNFIPILGAVRDAVLLSSRDGGVTGPHTTSARSAGRKFEAKVRESLRHSLAGESWNFRPAQWLSFSDDSGHRSCQVDVLLEPRGGEMPIVFEIKTARTARAWWQLHHLYGPVIESLFGRSPTLVEIVGGYSPVSIPGPNPVFLSSFEDLRAWLHSSSGGYGLLLARRVE